MTLLYFTLTASSERLKFGPLLAVPGTRRSSRWTRRNLRFPFMEDDGKIQGMTLAVAKGSSQTRPAFVSFDATVDISFTPKEIIKARPIYRRGRALRSDHNEEPSPLHHGGTEAGGRPRTGPWRPRTSAPVSRPGDQALLHRIKLSTS